MKVLHHRVEGSGPTVVLLHAGVADLRMWDTQVDEFVPGRSVVRCDLRGYGHTPLEPGADYCDAEDVLVLLAELGVDRFALVGASYGGYVALQVASAVPDRVERLVLLGAAADLVEPDESLRDFWRQEQALLAAGDLDAATELNLATWLGPDADDEVRTLAWRMQRGAFELQVAAGDVNNRDLAVDFDQITCPTRVVVGNHDLRFFRATARALAERLSHADLLELPWAAHLPSLERPVEAAHLVRTSLSLE